MAGFSNLLIFASVVAVLPRVLAQQPLYGQCGGEGWTGGTSCVSGAVCSVVNQWYSQCLPGTAATTTAATTRPPTTSTTTSPTSVPTSNGPNYWFSFGDSYTSTGFNSNGAIPNDRNPLGNPNFPGSPINPGSNWVGYLTGTYNNSKVFTYNYAAAGAVIDTALVSSSVPPVTSQVGTFLNTVGSKPANTPWRGDNSLFSVFIGINDIGATFYQSGDRGAFAERLMDSYFNQITRLYNVGARNFLFVSVPPVDRSPRMGGSNAGERTVILDYNKRLATRIASLKAARPDVKTFLWDAHAQFTQILDSPTTYGFRDAMSVGTAANQFWSDDYHPGNGAHKLFAERVGKTVLAGSVW